MVKAIVYLGNTYVFPLIQIAFLQRSTGPILDISQCIVPSIRKMHRIIKATVHHSQAEVVVSEEAEGGATVVEATIEIAILSG